MFSNRKKHKMAGKTSAHRDMVVRSQVIELIRAEKIKTTPVKAKILKSVFDRLVTHAKSETGGGKNKISSFFASNDRAIKRFYDVVEDKLQDRNSGYTRVIRTLPRKGDGAAQVYIMLVNSEAKEKKSRLKSLIDRKNKKEDPKGGSKIDRKSLRSEKKKSEAPVAGDSVKARRISM